MLKGMVKVYSNCMKSGASQIWYILKI